VDGRPSGRFLRAILGHAGVALAPGAHHIVMEYNPPGLLASMVLTLSSVLALLGLAFARRRGRRSS